MHRVKNRASGQAKTREVKAPSTKPYDERDDGLNAERFNDRTALVLSLSPEAAERVRTLARFAKPKPKRRKRRRA